MKKTKTTPKIVQAGRKPHYTAIAAITLDGKIAKHAKHFSNWTSKEDKIFLRKQLDNSDVVLVGHTTYQTAKKPLSKRNCIVLTTKVKTVSVENPNLILINPKTISIKKFITTLGYQKIAVLGGAQTYQYCLDHKLLNQLYLTIEPLSFSNGISLFSADISKTKKWHLLSTKKLNSRGTLLLHYQIS